jgi:hypothetical protein
MGPGQKHRTVVVTEHHTALQARRQEQQTPEFKVRMKHRHAIEGTQSEIAYTPGRNGRDCYSPFPPQILLKTPLLLIRIDPIDPFTFTS